MTFKDGFQFFYKLTYPNLSSLSKLNFDRLPGEIDTLLSVKVSIYKKKVY